jgi:hypothetical protein
MIITNTQLHTATPAQVNTTYIPYTHPCDFNYLVTEADLEAFEQALEEEDLAWLEVNVDESEEDTVLFTGIDTTYLTLLHDRIRYLTGQAITNFIDEIVYTCGDSPSLLQPMDPALVDVMEETIRMECVLGIIDPWN